MDVKGSKKATGTEAAAPRAAPKLLEEAEICDCLRKRGPMSLKDLVAAFRSYLSKETYRAFIDIVKKVSSQETINGEKIVGLKKEYR